MKKQDDVEKEGENERYFKFNSFAVILFQEVKPLLHAIEQALHIYNFDLVQRIEGQIMTIFTKRAYDLVGHTIDHLSSYAYDVAIDGQDLYDRIPDLPTWP